jgi:hypothetical protein
VAAQGYSLDWRGDAYLAKARRGAVRGVDEFNLRVEGAQKQELYPGHGKITGFLQRGIQAEPAREMSPTIIRGRVLTRGVRYARPINRRYRYAQAGYQKVRSSGRDILVRHIRQELGL